MKIYLDFDGTCVEHKYPEIGYPNPGALKIISRLQKANHEIILNTYRADLDNIMKNNTVQDALNYLNFNPEIKLELIFRWEKNKLAPPDWGWDFINKTQTMFIDDIAYGIPLIKCNIIDGNMVDWNTLETQFEENGII